MTDPTQQQETEKALSSRFPTAYTILFLLIIFVAALTWIIPAGKYDRVMSDEVGREIAVPGTYQVVEVKQQDFLDVMLAPTNWAQQKNGSYQVEEAKPQGFVDVMLAPTAGFYNPDSYVANAIDVALFVLFLGGFLGVMNATGAIDTGIRSAMRRLEGRELWMIPILMTLFAFGGTTYGMAEETLAFYAILIPVIISAGYDAVTGVAIVMVGAGIGVLGSTINPFATVIAANAASIPFTDGMGLRLILLVGGLIICAVYVMRYAKRVKEDSSRSVVAKQFDAHREYFLQKHDASVEKSTLTGVQSIALVIFALTFGVMIWGVSSQDWWMAQMGGLFMGSAILIGFIGRLGEKKLTESFVDGARDLLGVALVVGLARGIVVIMEQGMIADTILYSAETTLGGLPELAFINLMFWIEVGMSFFVPSSSGLAVLSMPILAPLADFAHVDRALVVTAFQSASGLVNMVNPTFAVVLGGLAIGRVSYDRWLVFIWPLLLILTVFITLVLSVGALM